LAAPATTRHREAEGSSYYRHFYMGLIKEDGAPKLALRHFADYTPEMGICQWFHFEDHRLDDAVRWMKRLGIRHVRTGLSWADSFRPDADAWFDRQMKALEEELGLALFDRSKRPPVLTASCASVSRPRPIGCGTASSTLPRALMPVTSTVWITVSVGATALNSLSSESRACESPK